ncbi:MAG: hypothetical protein ABI901_04695, partial [Roseiflexaceae bacterium]
MRQIAIFKAMGMGGFHMHARTGLATAYLGDEFMSLVRACVERAKREGLLAWLYDEDRWPSGFAGGLATSEPCFRARQLLFTRFPYGGADSSPIRDLDAFGQRADNGVLLARYDVVLRDGRLARYCRLAEGAGALDRGTVWYAYLETMLPTPWYNNQAYVDTLNSAAIERFIALTHARYAEVVGEHFGSVIPAIFTDEPQVIHKQCFAYAEEPRDLIVPWTDNLCMTYRQTYGESLEERLPELFWELPGDRASSARYRYHDHVCERFGTAFVDPVRAWCDAHGLALTGHLMHEPTLGSQTAALGETMRLYRGFGLPGIDILCDQREYTSVKQAQSVAHQYGRPGVLSELYGVTNWDFDFAGHKAQGDWQAALGVTMRVHHLAWVSMAGEAKRDYPASIGEQSPWHHEYRLIEDHFARLNTALTCGQPLVRVGVIHPIESYWLCFGPLNQTGSERAKRERAFADLTSGLLFGMIDFDFIAESLLAELCPLEPTDGRRPTLRQAQGRPNDDRRSGPRHSLQVGAMRYDAVIVPGLRTIRATTLDRLERFHTCGGTLIFAGEIPTLVDAEPSQRARELAETCQRVALAPGASLDALAPFREASVWQADHQPSRSILHQIRVDGDRRYAFFCNADKQRACEHSRIALQGAWQASVLETLTGVAYPIGVQICNGITWIDWDFPAHSSLLLELGPDTPASRQELVAPARGNRLKERRAQPWREREQLAGPVPITLSEPNVLLLDQAAFRLNDERWQPEEEILRIDALLRRRLRLPLRTSHLAQPWAQASASAPTDTISLRFTIHTRIDIASPSLALEDAAQTDIRLDGQLVRHAAVGWFVDQAIEIIRLPR